MERPIFIMKNVSISQRAYSTGSHKYLQAIDINGKDTGIEAGIAPCRVKILGVFTKEKTGFNNTVLFGTCDEYGNSCSVECADGSKRVLTFALTHDNDISWAKKGAIYTQLQEFYHEGTKGYATGNHIHLEIGLGWQTKKYKDEHGNWCLKNLIAPDKVFWLLKGYSNICNKGLNGYSFPWTDNKTSILDTVTSPTVSSSKEETMRLKLKKGSIAPNRYPTRMTVNGAFNRTTYFIEVGDIVEISDMKSDTKGNVVCKISNCISNGKSTSVLNNRWFAFDKNYFE